MEAYEQFFTMNGDMSVRVHTDRGQWVDIGSLEYVYQQFKARMVHELIGEPLAENKELFRQARNPTSP